MFHSLAQEEGEPTPHAIKMDFKLPTAISNRSFKNIMSGLADIDLAYQYHFEKIHLIAGIGVKYGYWNLEPGSFTNDVVSGRLEILSPQVNLGYRSVLGEKSFMDYEIYAGYGKILTNSNKCPDVYSQEGPIISPKISFYIRGTDLLYFSAAVNYTFMNASFTPDNLCMTTFPSGISEDNVGKYQYFGIGFGFYAIIPSFK